MCWGNLPSAHFLVNGEFWAIASDEPTTLTTFQEYGLRFDIEENFGDDQSNGWNIQRSEIRSVVALSRLWFVLALATLSVTAQGDAVVAMGKRPIVVYPLVSRKQLFSHWVGMGQSIFLYRMGAD